MSPENATKKYCIDLEDIQLAGSRIEGIAHRTPVLTSQSLLSIPGKRFFFKVEALQKTGSFKFRGALNAVKYQVEKQGLLGHDGVRSLEVVAHSSGNFAQALALAAKLASSTGEMQVSATIVMPKNAPIVKKRAVEDFGAKIVMVENTNEARESEADRIVESTGAILVHPSDEPLVIAGQGTASLEFVEQVRQMASQELDVVIIPVGGGGLASGNAVALRGLLGDQVKIILAEPAEVDDAKRSFDAKTRLGHAPDNKLATVADGLRTMLGPNTWPIVRDLVDDIYTVSEEDILRATKLVWERLMVCIEPSSGVGVAVAQSLEFNKKYSTEAGIHNVGIILSGGNVDIIKISGMMKDAGM